MKILAIGAHPDDIEIFMYGLLAKLKQRGDKIILCVATDGSLGGTQEKYLSRKRLVEAKNGLKALAEPFFLNLPDGSLGHDNSHYISIKAFIEKKNPDLIITHYKKDYHSDHRNLSKIIKNIASHHMPILYCDTMVGLNFNPNYYIDISEHFIMKTKSIMCHKSQKPKRFVDLAILMNSYRAAQCNSPKGSFVEAYKFERNFPLISIQNLLPSSPSINKFVIDRPKGFL